MGGEGESDQEESESEEELMLSRGPVMKGFVFFGGGGGLFFWSQNIVGEEGEHLRLLPSSDG